MIFNNKLIQFLIVILLVNSCQPEELAKPQIPIIEETEGDLRELIGQQLEGIPSGRVLRRQLDTVDCFAITSVMTQTRLTAMWSLVSATGVCKKSLRRKRPTAALSRSTPTTSAH